jgi:hypothetical protein
MPPMIWSVAMKFSAVDNAGGALVTHASAIGQALQSLDTALGSVWETWYASGIQSRGGCPGG